MYLNINNYFTRKFNLKILEIKLSIIIIITITIIIIVC